MLAILILVLSHALAVLLGVGIRSITLRARQDQLAARDETLGLRELLVNGRADQVRRGVVLGTDDTAAQRPWDVPAQPSLLNATLAQAQAILSEARVRQEQERREFIEIMNRAMRPAMR